jgi:hypothetical protein
MIVAERNILTAASSQSADHTALRLLPHRQCVLFAAACARLSLEIWVEHYPDDDRPLKAILVAEAFGKTGYYAVNAANAAAVNAANANVVATGWHAAYSAAYANSAAKAAACAAYAAHNAAYANSAANADAAIAHAANAAGCTVNARIAAVYAYAAASSVRKATWDRIYCLYQAALPKGRVLCPEWASSLCRGLADQAIATGNYEILPILADSLEEAGCNDVGGLLRLRNGEGAFSDWLFFGLLGSV